MWPWDLLGIMAFGLVWPGTSKDAEAASSFAEATEDKQFNILSKVALHYEALAK